MLTEGKPHTQYSVLTEGTLHLHPDWCKVLEKLEHPFTSSTQETDSKEPASTWWPAFMKTVPSRMIGRNRKGLCTLVSAVAIHRSAPGSSHSNIRNRKHPNWKPKCKPPLFIDILNELQEILRIPTSQKLLALINSASARGSSMLQKQSAVFPYTSNGQPGSSIKKTIPFIIASNSIKTLWSKFNPGGTRISH